MLYAGKYKGHFESYGHLSGPAGGELWQAGSAAARDK